MVTKKQKCSWDMFAVYLALIISQVLPWRTPQKLTCPLKIVVGRLSPFLLKWHLFGGNLCIFAGCIQCLRNTSGEKGLNWNLHMSHLTILDGMDRFHSRKFWKSSWIPWVTWEVKIRLASFFQQLVSLASASIWCYETLKFSYTVWTYFIISYPRDPITFWEW